MSVFSFLRDVVSADTESDQKKRLAKGQFRFYADQQRAQGNKTPGTNPVSQARNLAVGSAREVAKLNVSIPTSLAENAVNTVQKVRGKKPIKIVATPTDPVSKLVFGDAPIQTYETRRQGYEQALKSGESILPDSNKTKQFAGPLSFLGIAGTLASDVTPGGGAKSGLGKQLIKASTKEEVKKLIPSVGDDVAQAIATTKDPNIIKNILSKQDPNASQLESLKQEARNSKNAESFARKIGFTTKEAGDNLILYKGTGGELDMGGSRGFDYFNKVADSKASMPKNTTSYTQNFVRAQDYGKVKAFSIPKSAVLDEGAYTDLLIKQLEKVDGVKYTPADIASIKQYPSAYSGLWRRADKYPSLISDIKKSGFKAFKDTNGEVVVLDKSSVTDLYKSAQSQPPKSPPKSVAKPVKAKNIHPDDQGAMSDFIDLQRGVYKPDPTEAQALELEASRIAEHYDIPMPSTAKGLANEFDKQLTVERKSASKVLDVTPPTLREATFPTPKNPQSGESVLGNLALGGASKSNVSELFTGALKGTPASKGVSPEAGLKTLRKQQEELYTKARAERIAKLQQAGKNLDGTEGYIAERAALKGELPKVSYEGSIAQKQGVEAAEQAFTEARKTIKSVPDEEFIKAGLSPEWAKFNAQVAIRKITHGEGGVPTNSEIKLIEMVFGKDAAKEVAESLPLNAKVKELVANAVGIPRVLLTSIGDLSFGLRQGLVLGALHPKVWLDTNLKSVKFLANEDFYKKEMAKMLTDPDFKRISEEMKTALPSLTQASEEAFVANKFAEKIPFVKRTARAYDGAATYMRFQVAKKNLQAFDDIGIKLTDKELKDLGTMINTASGRGGKSGGWLDEHSGILSTALFSPRLWASRLQTINPQYYASLSGPARQEALKAAGSFAVVAGTMLTALAALGAQIETDPRSSDFLKAKFGNTRYDVFGGFQQNLVLLARELTGQKKSSLSGHISALSGEDKPYGGDNRLTVLGDMLNNKLNPILGTTGRLISGEDRAGQPIDFVDEMIKLLTPLNFQSSVETAQDTGSPLGAAKAIPSFFGIGVQTYGTKDLPLSDKQEGQLKLLEQKGVPKKDIESYKAFFQQLKVGPDRDATSNEINKTLATGDTAKAKEIAKKYNEKVMENIKPWLEENRGKTIPKPVLEYLNSSLINLTNASIKTRIQSIAENPDKYKLNFRSQ